MSTDQQPSPTSARETVHEFEAGRKTIRATLNLYRGKVYLDVREFYEPTLGAPLAPTRKGISIPSEYLDDLEDAVSALRAKVVPPSRRRNS